MLNLKGNYVCIDTETGGLDPIENSLLTVAIVMIKEGEIKFKEEWAVKHDVYNVTSYALKVNKLNLVEHDNTAIGATAIANKLKLKTREIFGDNKPSVIGHNVGFDLGFIFSQLMNKKEWETFFSYRNIDTAGIARFLIDCGKINSTKADLGTLMEYFDVGSDSDKDRHTALYDAENTLKIYTEMVKLTECKCK